jgi:lipopolysaccharide heptosyltransferase I
MDERAASPRVLIVRLGAMGDVLHALPALAMLRQCLPNVHIGWLIEHRWRELLCAPASELAGPRTAGRPLVDHVHLVDTRAWRTRPFRSEVRQQLSTTVRALREGHYAAALDVQGAMKSALLARLSGAAVVVGFREPREALARLFYARAVDSRAAHIIDQNLELARAWLEEVRPSSSRIGSPLIAGCGLFDVSSPTTQTNTRGGLLPRDPASEASVKTKLDALRLSGQPLAILNPGAGWGAKQWPAERYSQLAKALADRGLQAVVNYGPGEEALAAEVASASGGAAQPLSTTISEFIAVARRARLFIGGDTGPMHLAALLGVKTLALFGPTDPARNGPYWPTTRTLRDDASTTSYSHSRPIDAGLQKLSAERVLAEVDALLQS